MSNQKRRRGPSGGSLQMANLEHCLTQAEPMWVWRGATREPLFSYGLFGSLAEDGHALPRDSKSVWFSCLGASIIMRSSLP